MYVAKGDHHCLKQHTGYAGCSQGKLADLTGDSGVGIQQDKG